MTRPLRRAHRFAWIILAIALPVLFWASLAARRTTASANPHVLWESLR